MDLGGAGKARATINVTPLVDVVLVLLIIFMVITPLLEKELEIGLPLDSTTPVAPEQNEALTVYVRANGQILINSQPVAPSDLETRLRSLLQGSIRKIVFVQADDDALYSDAVAAMDAAKGAGALQLGTVLVQPQGK